MLWESNSLVPSTSEKVAAIEGNVSWKSGRSKKISLQEKQVFRKCSSSEEVDAVQKFLLRSKELFCRYLYSKQLLHQKKSCSEKNFLFSQSGCSVEVSFLKIRYSEKIAATRKLLFRKRNSLIKAVALKK